jgi:hypothetical protein
VARAAKKMDWILQRRFRLSGVAVKIVPVITERTEVSWTRGITVPEGVASRVACGDRQRLPRTIRATHLPEDLRARLPVWAGSLTN